MVEVARCTDQLGDFARTENHRQTQPLLWIGQILFHISPLEHFDVQEAESANVQDNGVDRQFPGFEQIRVVAPDVIGANLIDRSADVTAEMLHCFQVGMNRGCGVVAAYELFSHPLHEYCHRGLLVTTLCSINHECSIGRSASGFVQVLMWEAWSSPVIRWPHTPMIILDVSGD